MDFSSLPLASQPIFHTTKLNEPITLYEGEITINSGSDFPLLYVGIVQWRWLPSPNLIMEAEFQMNESQQLVDAHKVFMSPKNQIQVPGMAAINIIPTSLDMLRGNMSGKLQGMYKPLDSLDFTELVFHLPNFPNYQGYFIKTNSNGCRSGRIELQFGVWSVVIDNLDDTDEMIKSLIQEGGHAITHVGVLKRTDAALFNLIDAEPVMECLDFYLSFISGRWSPAILWVGRLTGGIENALITPANVRLDSWKSTNSWCNIDGINVADDIRALFPIFLERFTVEHELFRLSISWYLEVLSDKLVSDSRIILTQAALELLALSIPPLFGQKVKGKAENRLRGLFQLLAPSASLDVPSSLARLTAILNEAPANSWNKSSAGVADSASVIVSIRNLIAHPARTSDEKNLLRNTLVLYEASQLGVWFLEIVLLGWLSYSGHYRSRLVRFGWQDEGKLFPSASLGAPPTVV